MNKDFKIILDWLLDVLVNKRKIEVAPDKKDILFQMNMAFLSSLSQDNIGKPGRSTEFLLKMKESEQYDTIADFYLKGIDAIREEIAQTVDENLYFRNRLNSLAQWISADDRNIDENEIKEHIWTLFFPEGCGILKKETRAIDSLRKKRQIKIL